MNELRRALRRIRSSPARFAAGALTLGLGIGASTVLAIARSAPGTVMTAESVSFAGVPSATFVAVTVAVLVIIDAAVLGSTVTVIVSTSVSPAPMAPTSQSPVPGSYVPWVLMSD